jgi:hypothetical protein
MQFEREMISEELEVNHRHVTKTAEAVGDGAESSLQEMSATGN